jgi:hypothetical protein
MLRIKFMGEEINEKISTAWVPKLNISVKKKNERLNI